MKQQECGNSIMQQAQTAKEVRTAHGPNEEMIDLVRTALLCADLDWGTRNAAIEMIDFFNSEGWKLIKC